MARPPQRTYDKGERRYKHVGGSKPEIEFDRNDPKKWIGKCPSTLTQDDRARLLNEAVAAPNGDRELDVPKRLYVVHDGAIYEAQTSDRGTTYHAYPYRGKLSSDLLTLLEAMAEEKACADEFTVWVKKAHRSSRSPEVNFVPLEFRVVWPQADRTTTAELVVLANDEALWPVPGEPEVALEIQVDDLLSHLTEFWKPLLLRQTYPIPVLPETPSKLRAKAEERWSEQPAEVAEREDGIVAAFEEAHDISRCFAGYFELPPLWLLRAGDRLIVDTRAALQTVPFEAGIRALSSLGNQIAQRLGGSQNEQWAELLVHWEQRDQGEPATLLAWSTGLDREMARSFLEEGILSGSTTVMEAANDDDELRIAARMASALPRDQISQIITLVRSFDSQPAPDLELVSTLVRGHLSQDFRYYRAYEQGEAAAGFLRATRGLASTEAVDVFQLVRDLGVSLHHRPVAPPTLDALAVWGPRHGPAVLLNENSAHVGGDGSIEWSRAARVTLAHELCHLLLDRLHALSAIDVLNSKTPVNVEQRAKAFAGEFLLPKSVAAAFWRDADSPNSPGELEVLIAQLCRQYEVTRSVAAWKLEHGAHRDGVDLSVALDAVVPQR